MMNKIKKYVRYHFENKISKGSNFFLFLIIVASALSVVMVFLQSALGSLSQESFFDNWWYSLTEIVDIGNGDSFESRLINSLFWGFNIVIAGTIIAFLTAKVSEFTEKLNQGHSNVIDENHYVIIGWNSNIFKIFEEIKNANLNQSTPTVLCFNAMNNSVMREQINLEFPNQKNIRILTRSGNCYSIPELGITNLQNAKSVIILDDSLISNFDIETVILAVRKNIPNNNIPIIPQFSKNENIKVLSELKGNNIHPVNKNFIISSITGQTIRSKFINLIFMDLLDYDSDEIYFFPSDNFVGLTYAYASLIVDNITLIGIFNSDSKILLNPNKSLIITKDDKLVVIAADDDHEININLNKKLELEINSIEVQANKQVIKDKKSILIVGWSKLGQDVINGALPFLDDATTIDVIYRNDLVNYGPTINNEQIKLSTFKYDKDSNLDYEGVLLSKKYDIIFIVGYNDKLSEEFADTHSLMENLFLKSLIEKNSIENQSRIILHLNDGSKKILLDFEDDFEEEFIVSDVLSSLYITQLADNPNLKYIFNELFSLGGQAININAISNYKPSNLEQLATIKDLILLCISNNETFIGCIEDGNLYLNPSKNRKIKNIDNLSLVVIS